MDIDNPADTSHSVRDQDDAVQCMHGPSECLGNIIELCAATLYPDPKIHLGFAMCMTNDLSHIPAEALVKGCSLEHGIDFEKLNDCASKEDGSFGMDLLRQSVTRTSQANVTRSCTVGSFAPAQSVLRTDSLEQVRLNDSIRCIRDGGEWKDCARGSRPRDLIHDIVNATSG